MAERFALKIHEQDNVATIFTNDVHAGDTAMVKDSGGQTELIPILSDIPYGHKIALTDIKAGQRINKYGEEIGIASVDITRGAHVHIHNLESMRGRGDLAGKGDA